ncbi:Alkaline phosphatase [Xenorhabdus mauleonii]|uniref:Alkaline phosphatase n=1 Tax=Xenorhabdus mauleonii TaxID=351675 RepID=A0A1I3WUM4_9GAMM|nr:metallophosphoesterase family protein [Xenorhabdus mauleonii]PHM38149.1 Alkaline phosphatase [Xenorhabdus mauleonii]SFK10567.1 Purple acid Phosphatase, N-terminal domain [Xenorhabdus mauleonii]
MKLTLKKINCILTTSLIACSLFGFSHAQSNITNNPLTSNATLHRADNIHKIETIIGTIDKPNVAPIYKNNKPNRITSTLKKQTDTERSFRWFTSDVVKSPVVMIDTHPDMKNATAYPAETATVESHYLERDKDGFFIYKVIDDKNNVVRYFTDAGITDIKWEPKKEVKNKNEKVAIDIIPVKEVIYSADINGLSPETVYYYQVGDKNGELSQIGQFKTSSSPQKPFSFIQYTDTQNAYWNEHIRNEAQFGADTIQQAQEKAPDAEFVIHTGDIVEIGEVEDEWVDLMSQSQNSLLKMSFVPVSGNHDEYGLNTTDLYLNKFNDHFNVDSAGKIDGGSYYSFDYNNAHFIVLNTNDYKNEKKKSLSKEQLKWLENDVKQARKKGAEWVILSYHKPLFSKSYHSLQDEDVQNVREDFMKLIDQLDIDLALQGHDHVFSRTKSLKYADKVDSFVNAKIDNAQFTYDENNYKKLISPSGTTFVIPNTGGTKAYDAIFNKPLTHIHEMRPKLNWLTQEQLEHYNNLFEVGYQPQNSERFKTKHENYRDSSVQNFAVYTIDNNQLTGEIYQVTGDLSKGEKRSVELIDKFYIEK